MKRTILKLSLIALLFSACSKSSDDATSTNANSWTLGSNTYTAAAVAYQTSGSQAAISATATGYTSTNLNSLAFNFWSIPTNGQQLTINNTYASGTIFVTASKMVNSVITSYSNKATTVKATVTIANSKVSVNFPGTIWVYNNNNANDSLQLSAGTITQN